MYLHFISFLHTVFGILPFGKREPGVFILHSQLPNTVAAYDPATDLIWRGLPRRRGDHHYLSSSELYSLRTVFFFHAPPGNLEVMTTDRIKLSNHITSIHRLHFMLAMTVTVRIIPAQTPKLYMLYLKGVWDSNKSILLLGTGHQNPIIVRMWRHHGIALWRYGICAWHNVLFLTTASNVNCWADVANHVTRLWQAGDTDNFKHWITGLLRALSRYLAALNHDTTRT